MESTSSRSLLAKSVATLLFVLLCPLAFGYLYVFVITAGNLLEFFNLTTESDREAYASVLTVNHWAVPTVGLGACFFGMIASFHFWNERFIRGAAHFAICIAGNLAIVVFFTFFVNPEGRIVSSGKCMVPRTIRVRMSGQSWNGRS